MSAYLACATARLSTCSLAWSAYRPGFVSGLGREIMLSEFRCVCY